MFVTKRGCRPFGCMVTTSVRELDRKLLLLRFIKRKFNALNLQLQFPWQLFYLRPSARGACSLGKGAEPKEGIVNLGDWRAFCRIPMPAFLEEFPDWIGDLVDGPLGTFPEIYLLQYNGIVAPGVWRAPRQDLEDSREI